MDYNEIRALLKKYWAAETGPKEERLLRDFFAAHHNVPPDLHRERDLFLFFRQQASFPVLDEDILSKLSFPAEAKIISFWPKALRYAAVLVPLVIAGYFFREGRGKTEKESVVIKATIKDKDRVVKETNAALAILAVNLKDGLSGVKQLEVLENLGPGAGPSTKNSEK
jgi:hypothetical protein